MSRRKQIYEGKAKILYEGPEPGTLVQYFKDDATAFNAQKKAILDGKGVLNNRISEFIMIRLGEIGIPTHFIKRLIPLEVICRNVAAGTMAKRLGMDEGTKLPRAVVEFCLKRDDLGDPLIAEEHIHAFGWASHAEVDEMIAMTLRINDYLQGMFAGIGIKLIDFKIEFGRLDVQLDSGGMGHQVVLADEISPDSCRLWDRETDRKMDKDRFRRDLGDVTEAYTEVATRLGILKEANHKGAPKLSVVSNDD